MATNTITHKIIRAIEVYIKYEVSDDKEAVVVMYEELCEEPEEWVCQNMESETKDVTNDGIGYDIYHHGYNNIDWDIVKEYMMVDYKQYLAQCKIDEEDENSEASHSNSDSE